MKLFQNSTQRLERARQHLTALDREWISLFAGEPAIPEIRYDDDAANWVVTFLPTPEFIKKVESNTLSLILGEIAYQLRAALDGLIWDAITYTQGSEPAVADANRVEFPLLPLGSDFRKCGFHKFLFPQKLSDWIETIQPGTPDKPVGHPDRGLQNTLEDIHQLARKDRHRRLRLIGVVPGDAEVEVITKPPGGIVVWNEWKKCNLFDGNYEFLRFKVVVAGVLTPYNVRLKTKAGFHIFAEDLVMYDGEPFGTQINRFIEAVSRVIERFENEFR